MSSNPCSGESEEPKKTCKIGKRECTPEQFFKPFRRDFTKLILQNSRDKWAARRNLHQLLALACEQSVYAGRPLVKIRGTLITPWLASDDPEPDKKPTTSDAPRMHGMGIRWD